MSESEKTSVTEEMVPDFEIEVGSSVISKERVIAAVRAALMLASSVATMAGFAFDADFVYQVALCVLMLASMIWGYWKNNNWTVNAVTAQKVKNGLSSKE